MLKALAEHGGEFEEEEDDLEDDFEGMINNYAIPAKTN